MKINNDIQSDFQMIGNQIISISLKNNFLELPDSENLNLEMSAEYEIESTIKHDSCYIGVINLTVKAEAKEKGKKKKISITICISGGFGDSHPENEESFRNMLSLNGCAALYSIARAQVISLSSQSMNGGQLILPMINVFKMKEKKEEK